jgi:hypothetical protein
MKLFEEKEVGVFTAKIQEGLKGEVAKFSDDEILSCNFDEWANYFESKYRVEPIIIYENNIEKDMKETKVRQYNAWSKHDSYEPEYYSIDGYEIIFTVPFDGESELWLLQPSTRILTHFDIVSLNKPGKDFCGNLVLSSSYTTQELKSQENVGAFVDDGFTHTFRNYKTMIGYVNAEIESFNRQIRGSVLQFMEVRKQKADDYACLSKSLNIPIKLNPNAPSITPVPLQRVARKSVTKPAVKPASPEFSISDAEYRNIIKIIHNACASMEATAKSHSKFGEEELRDNILATLNTHYTNMTTGETFRKNGKTDIHIMFENKAAFIGECKVWHGIKKFEEAVEQLFGYSTWRDTKTAIIVFNKNNKDFAAVQESVLSWITEHTIPHRAFNDTIYQWTLHRDDKNIDVDVAVAMYDLTV